MDEIELKHTVVYTF